MLHIRIFPYYYLAVFSGIINIYVQQLHVLFSLELWYLILVESEDEWLNNLPKHKEKEWVRERVSELAKI